MKKNKKIIIIGISILVSVVLITPTLAQQPSPSTFSEGSEIATALQKEDGRFLPEYLRAIYQIGIAIVAVLATVVIMWGGLQWIMAGGNVSRIENAKSLIYGSVLGLVIALSSFVLLNTINPQLVTPQINTPAGINNTELAGNLCCYKKGTSPLQDENIYIPYPGAFGGSCEQLGMETRDISECKGRVGVACTTNPSLCESNCAVDDGTGNRVTIDYLYCESVTGSCQNGSYTKLRSALRPFPPDIQNNCVNITELNTL